MEVLDQQEKNNNFLRKRIEELEEIRKRGIRKVSLPMDGKTFLVDEAISIFKQLIKE